MADYFDLGTYQREVTTTSEQARLWFTRGLVWTYGFNHEEAVSCFERALAADGRCALAHWGLAFALGPNYNKPWEAFDPEDLSATVARAHAASQAAIEAAAQVAAVTPAERALIEALAARYPSAERPATARPGTARPGTTPTPTPCAPPTARTRVTWTWPCCSRTR